MAQAKKETMMTLSIFLRPLTLTLFLVFLSSIALNAQTSAFSYQGKLSDAGAAANGNYNLTFNLFAASTGGTALATQNVPNATVTNGVFTVSLNFGAALFDGSDRYIEVAVGTTVLRPRPQILSSPYAVRSANAANADNADRLGGVAAAQYVVTTDTRMTDARIPTAGSANYIQNTSTQQAASNFNVSGNGTAGGTLSGNVVNATTQYNLGGSRVMTASNTNFFAGLGAGITGSNNTFVGNNAGAVNTSGSANGFFGPGAGDSNTTGSENMFFGFAAGQNTTTGNSNTFFGSGAGQGNVTGSSNTVIGRFANVGGPGLSNATAIGAGVIVSTDNTMVLGRSLDTVQVPGILSVTGTFTGGIINATTQYNLGGSRVMTASNTNFFAGLGAGITGSNNTFVGNNAGAVNTTGSANGFFGPGAGDSNMTGSENMFFGFAAGQNTTTGNSNTFFGSGAGQGNVTGSSNTVIGRFANVGGPGLSNATAIGAGVIVSTDNTMVLGRSLDTVQVPGILSVTGTFTGGIINATTQYNLGGSRVMTASNTNFFAGLGAGITGSNNTFVGNNAGAVNTSGSANGFFGPGAGDSNMTGSENMFFGFAAGQNTTTGNSNTFFGSGAGQGNVTGSSNTVIGRFANVGGPGLSNATAIGAGVIVSTDNTMVLGRSLDSVQIPGILNVAGTAHVGINNAGACDLLLANDICFFDEQNGTLAVRDFAGIGYAPIRAGAYTNASSIALKKNINQLGRADYNSMLGQIVRLPLFNYRYKNESGTAPLHTGLIAERSPASVLSADGKAVDLYDFISLNAGATKALAQKVSALTAENAELKLRLNRIERRLSTKSVRPVGKDKRSSRGRPARSMR